MKKQAGGASLPRAIRKGIKKSLEGETPFLLAPVNWAAKKKLGDKKVHDFYWKYFQKPLVKADIGAGMLAQKGTKAITRGRGGGLWTEKKVLPTGKPGKHGTGGKEYEIPSALAPVSKAGKFAIPLLGAMKLEEMVSGRKKMSDKKIVKEADLKKTAEMLVRLNDERNMLQKEAKATELLYKQAELGQIKMPATFAEYQEKVAELLGKDLNVMEEAIKMASSAENDTLGGLDSTPGKGVDAQTAFQNALLD